MKEMLKRKLNKKGFTLAELLIVVAIMAVLVAVAIPIFTSGLDKAQLATDDANFRTAQAVAANLYLNSKYDASAPYSISGQFFDAKNSKWVASSADAYKAQSSTNSAAPYIVAGSDGTVEWDDGK